MSKYYSIHEFSKIIGVSAQTLRNWDANGKLHPHHTTVSGYRYYSDEQLNQVINVKPKNRITIGYCRVSSHKQKDDLERQIDNTEKSEQQELVEDLVQMITVFSCKLQGKRANKAKKLIRELIRKKVPIEAGGKLYDKTTKERGRKKSLNKIVDMAVEQSKGWENEIIMITHGDCLKDAEYVAGRVREKMGIENILINNIGTVIGSHTGPGVVAVFCMGNER